MQLLPLEIRNRVSFFERLEKDVEKASVGSELRILYEVTRDRPLTPWL